MTDSYSWKDISLLTDEDFGNLLDYYPTGHVPSMEELTAMRVDDAFSAYDVFDGSFGFSVGV